MQDPSVILSNLGKAKSFSINNGKYEFLRMPFGLTNAPRIFQRAINILREQLGKTCHVCMDDIIIFPKTIEQHYRDLIVIIKILLNENMKISIEKSKFFKLETTFLGYVVSYIVIKTDPEKICTIFKYPILKNI